MAALDDDWKAGSNLGSQIIDEFRIGFPRARQLFVFGDSPFGVDEAFGWLFFQGWYVEFRAAILVKQVNSASAASIAESYVKGFGDTLYYEITGGRNPLSERDVTLLKAFDNVRNNLSSGIAKLSVPKNSPDPWGAMAVRLFGLAVIAVCSEDVVKAFMPIRESEDVVRRAKQCVGMLDSLLEPLHTRLSGFSSSLRTGSQGATLVTPKAEFDWPRLSEEALSGLTPEEKQTVRDLERKGIVGESMATQDIVMNCQNKFQFAKTYRVLRNDRDKTLAQIRSAISSHRREVVDAVAKAYEQIIDFKLGVLSDHFAAKWGQPIANYGWNGCAVIVSCFLCIVAWTILLIVI
jgi:hypothetical protein